MLTALFIFMVILAAITFSYIYYDLKCGVPTYPATMASRQATLEIVQKEFARWQTANAQPQRLFRVVDMGSGSGQLCRYLAKTMPQAEIIGVELSFVPWLRSAIRQKISPLPNLKFCRQDFWSYNCQQHDVVILYLGGGIMGRMGDKLKVELPDTALIISNRFLMPEPWQPETVHTLSGFLENNLYLYRHKV